MQIDQAKAWNKTGMQIARGYADKLDDITNNCAYSKYFYLLLLFDGDNGTGAIPQSHLKYAIDRLAKRRVSISSKSPLKQLLGDFLSYCTLMFSSETALEDAKQTLINNQLLPSAVEVLGTKIGTDFVAGRYDDIVGERMGREWSADLSLFHKLNWRVMAIGEWLGEQRDNASTVVALIVVVLGVILFVTGVISAYLDGGIIMAIIAAVIFGAILYYGGMLVIGISFFATRIIFTILRYVFYNIYTLVGAILLLILNHLR